MISLLAYGMGILLFCVYQDWQVGPVRTWICVVSQVRRGLRYGAPQILRHNDEKPVETLTPECRLEPQRPEMLPVGVLKFFPLQRFVFR